MSTEYIEKLECLLAHTYDILDDSLYLAHQPSGLNGEKRKMMGAIKELGLHTKDYEDNQLTKK